MVGIIVDVIDNNTGLGAARPRRRPLLLTDKYTTLLFSTLRYVLVCVNNFILLLWYIIIIIKRCADKEIIPARKIVSN